CGRSRRASCARTATSPRVPRATPARSCARRRLRTSRGGASCARTARSPWAPSRPAACARRACRSAAGGWTSTWSASRARRSRPG
ncbi:MAG: hypothetical protein AVDCRST_MAG13-1355, partial [uncultured Solirubrobacteraceae bacterium]